MGRIALYFFAAALLLSFGCFSQPEIQSGNSSGRVLVVFYGANASVSAEKAQTEQARDRGLMFRASLGENDGMLFYFAQEQRYSFWMKNTFIPLEAIFLDSNLVVVDIMEMDPCTVQGFGDCPSYIPARSALYVLEVNQNFSSKHGISTGQQAMIRGS